VPQWEGHWSTRASSEKATELVGAGALGLWKESGGAGLVQPGAEMAWRDLTAAPNDNGEVNEKTEMGSL